MRLLLAGLTAALAIPAVPASAASLLLTFEGDPPACTDTNGGNANQQCTGGGQFVGVNYGTTATLAVSWVSASAAQPSFRTDARTTGDYGAASSGSGNVDEGGPYASIIFTPLAGYEVSFTSLNYFRGSATSAPGRFRLLDEENEVVFTQDVGSAGTGNPTITFDSDYYSGPLTLQFGSFSGSMVIDDLLLDVREIAVTAPVPEPASWAMLIAGFGVIGSALRRKPSQGRLRLATC